MEALLKVEFPEYVNIQAYADDIALSIAGPNRRTLIERAEAALVPVLSWAEGRGLSFSAQKSSAMLTKGGMVPGFTLAFGEERIATVECVRYLGILLDQKRLFSEHLGELKKSSETLFTKLRGTLGSGWGMKRENIATLYRGVFLPKIAYGARFWVHTIKTNRAIKTLGSIQRRALLGMTSAYCTTSTDALQVLAGVPPLDLEIRWLVLKAEVAMLPNHLRQQSWTDGREELLDEWQTRWTATTKGRWTFKFFPDVRNRLKLPLALGHDVTQFLSGHGNFRAKLAGFNLQPSPLCACEEGEEDANHVLFDCGLHTVHRAHLELAVHRAGHLWPCDPIALVSTARTYTALVRFAKIAAYLERP
ncbi:reverse transcriptase, partial [Thalictrum thalictroides]